MKLKQLIVGMVALASVPSVMAQKPEIEADTQATDSCAAAYATIMAGYLRPELAKYSTTITPDDISEFVAGMRHAFEIRDQQSPYYLGVRIGLADIDRFDGMVSMGFPLTPDNYTRQLENILQGKDSGFDKNSADAFLRAYIERLYPQPKPLDPQSQQAFLNEQKKRAGVMETPTGLLFEIITEGEGRTPESGENVRVTYTGRLADGTIFDQTDRPVEFPVDRLVPGFTEGLKMMKTGGEYRIFIPAELGYGEEGAGVGAIPGNAVLDFTVRLLEIVSPAESTTTD